VVKRLHRSARLPGSTAGFHYGSTRRTRSCPSRPYRVRGAPSVDLVARVEVRRELGVAAAAAVDARHPDAGGGLAVHVREVGRHEAGDAARRGVAGLFHALTIFEYVAKPRRSGSTQDGGHEEHTSRRSASHVSHAETPTGRSPGPLVDLLSSPRRIRGQRRGAVWRACASV
jgi:hypothetical protein